MASGLESDGGGCLGGLLVFEKPDFMVICKGGNEPLRIPAWCQIGLGLRLGLMLRLRWRLMLLPRLMILCLIFSNLSMCPFFGARRFG